MFNNIGKKIQFVSKIIFWVDVILNIAAAFVFFILAIVKSQGELAIYGSASLILGPVVAYLSAIITYGFGELIENSAQIRINTTVKTTDTAKTTTKKVDAKPQEKETWKCKACGAENPLSTISCRDCGKMK